MSREANIHRHTCTFTTPTSSLAASATFSLRVGYLFPLNLASSSAFCLAVKIVLKDMVTESKSTLSGRRSRSKEKITLVIALILE